MDGYTRLQNVFRNVFGDEGLTLCEEFSQATYADWDSVATVQLALEIESEFSIRFTTDEVAGLGSVREIVAALEKRGAM